MAQDPEVPINPSIKSIGEQLLNTTRRVIVLVLTIIKDIGVFGPQSEFFVIRQSW